MVKEGLILLLGFILVVLAFALKQLLLGRKADLDKSFRVRIALSILLMSVVIFMYLFGGLQPSVYVQYL